MFTRPPKILAHQSSLGNGNFVVPEYILNRNQSNITLFNRWCPHRMYPLADPGTTVENILCNFHGFEWAKDGTPINNNRKIACGNAQIGKSGLVFKDFVEPNHKWVDDLASETNLEYSHSCFGSSEGSWLWMMEIQTDLLHIRTGDNVVHPWLSSVEDLDNVTLESGDGWVIQTCSTGWWLCIYPFVFIEWSQGCLGINYTTPTDIDSEFGFTWMTQFYYDPSISQERRDIFEKLEDVFREDVVAIEKQKGQYFPITVPYNRLEEHCVHFGKWVKDCKVR